MTNVSLMLFSFSELVISNAFRGKREFQPSHAWQPHLSHGHHLVNLPIINTNLLRLFRYWH